MKWLALVAAAVLIQDAPPGDDTLRAAWGRLSTPDPALAWSVADRRVAEALFGGFEVTIRARADGAELEFPEVKWSDGRPVTAEDFRFAWLRILDPATGSPWVAAMAGIAGAREYHDGLRLSRALLDYESTGNGGRDALIELAGSAGTGRHVAGLKAAAESEGDPGRRGRLVNAAEQAESREDAVPESVGITAGMDRTLRIRGSFGPARREPLHLPWLPVPRHVVTAHPADWTHPQHLVSCGPYRVEKWTRGEVSLVRAGAGASPSRVAILPLERPAEAWPLYEKGALDWIDGSLVPPEKLEALVKADELRSEPSASVWALQAMKRGALEKDGIRRAVAQGLLRSALAQAAGVRASEVASLEGVEVPARDLPAALAAIVTEHPDLSKFPRLNLLAPKGGPGEALAKLVREQLQGDLGLSVRLDLRERPAWEKAFAGGEYDLAVAEFFAPPKGDGDPPDPMRAAALKDCSVIPLVRTSRHDAAKSGVTAGPGHALADVRLSR